LKQQLAFKTGIISPWRWYTCKETCRRCVFNICINCL